jgi:hypothetical protein
MPAHRQTFLIDGARLLDINVHMANDIRLAAHFKLEPGIALAPI